MKVRASLACSRVTSSARLVIASTGTPLSTSAEARQRICPQLWSMLVYGSGGSLLLGSLNGFAVAEAHAIDHLSEALRAVQPTPVPLGRLGKLEDHCKGGLA